ncbi:MAG: hypothetical protein IT483_01700 [Gammaproteobacteria bacterium]|nr:hypothetical protein [Gammaproteobacteria bacterium]
MPMDASLHFIGKRMSATPQRRLLGIDARVLLTFITALVCTWCIFLLQNAMRADQFEPESLRIFPRLFLFEDYPATLLYLAALTLALVPAVQRAAVALIGILGSRPLLTCSAALPVLAAGSLVVYHQHPLSMDEYAPYFQSRIFAAGSLYGQFRTDILDWLVYPPFQGHFIHVSRTTGQVASAYWPGFALLLTPFTAMGVPWLGNPLLGACGIWVVQRLVLELTRSHEAAGAAALFMVGSGAYMVYSISFYSMTAHLVCNAAFALLLLKPSFGRCLAAGFIGGLALCLHNPVPHLFFAAPWLIWLAWRREWRHLTALAAAYLPWVILIGFGWYQLLHGLADGRAVAGSTGSDDLLLDAFRIFAGIFSIPTPVQLTDRMIELAKLWLWAAPALALFAAAGYRMHRADRRWNLLFASAVTTLIGYFFIPLDQGHGWGYRYFHSAWFVLPVLAAGVLTAPASSTEGWRLPMPLVRYGAGLGLCGALLMTPLFAYQVHGFIAAHLRQMPITEHGTPRVLIISTAMGYYAQDLGQNDPFLRGSIITMVSRGAKHDEAMMARAFPELVMLSRGHRGSVWGSPGPATPDVP